MTFHIASKPTMFPNGNIVLEWAVGESKVPVRE